MKLLFPDAQDFVDPDFDFIADCTGPDRERYHTDLFAHEILDKAPYDGLLLSKSIVDGCGRKSGKYTMAQRHRLRRVGVHRFFRVEDRTDGEGAPFPIMGDCGAFSYMEEPEPPISVDEAIEFYETCGFTHGQAVDHIIPNYNEDWDGGLLFEQGPPEDVLNRFEITLRLAAEFKRRHEALGCRFVPIGVAQGWSPQAYLDAVRRLQDLGYDYIALGGLVPLKSPQFMAVLKHVMPEVREGVKVHVLGVLRWEHLDAMIELGVASVDTTSPLRRAFLDNKANYFTGQGDDEAYAAIRIPQMDGNPRLKRRVLAGEVDLDEIRLLEQRCLDRIRLYDGDPKAVSLDDLLDDLDAYILYLDPKARWRGKNQRSLEAGPWRQCDCRICRDIGVEVILFRGANRNRRRGFHNLHVAYRRLQEALARHVRRREEHIGEVGAHA